MAITSSQPADTTVARPRPQILVVTTAMLVFISFWRAAAIVLCDMASTAYYIGGIVERAIGKAAPWYIFAVMLFAYAVRGVYLESCSMFVRGGVYRVVKEALGGTMAKLSVSALMFDYVLTGPISGVSAGQYLVGLANELLHAARVGIVIPPDAGAVLVALAITAYFWWQNVLGIEESSDKAVKIMAVTTVMVVVVIGWSVATIWARGAVLPPVALQLSDEALGWTRGTTWARIGVVGVIVAFGHSILAMSGEESLAQVNREIAHPKVRNLIRAGFVIFLYSLIMTGLMSFFAVLIIPDELRTTTYSENLIGGLAMHVVGPLPARLVLHAFVVLVGFLVLSGAANTAIIGSNGVLNRVAEDGILSDWFRVPHRRYGTTVRLINLVVGLQMLTILLSRGNVYALGEAYAFGVVWSFVFKTLSMVVLRFKDPRRRAWRVPGNLRVGAHELPMGLVVIFAVLAVTAVANLLTKRTATQWGTAFTVVFFFLFWLCERARGRRGAHVQSLEHFNVRSVPDPDPLAMGVRPGCVLVPVRDPDNLAHLETALDDATKEGRDVVVPTVKVERGVVATGSNPNFTPDAQRVFSAVVALAEEHGTPVVPIIITSNDLFFAVARTAQALGANEVVFGPSSKIEPHVQAESFALRWGAVEPDPTRGMIVRVVAPHEDLRFTI